MTTSFIEQYNDLFTKIEKAKTVDDMRTLLSTVKKFYSMNKNIDTTSVNDIFEKYTGKLHGLVEENEFMYNHINDEMKKLNNQEYDFKTDKDDTSAVHNKVLQLMAELPKKKTTANAGNIKSLIEKTIKSGVIGCKAVLELLKYPVYVDMIDERQKDHAFSGSKSEEQRAFENIKEKEMKNMEKACANVYLQGFHLRNLLKQATKFKTSSAWAN